MNRNLQFLASQPYDLIIVGGGFFGICAAWDAVQRGLSVALIEQGDWSAATSANHFRMIHGGIRYLQHGDVYRVRESSYERSALLRVAPHLVHPLPIVIPTYGHGMKGKEILSAGMALYDLITLDRNRGIPDPKRHIPPGRAVSRQEILSLYPDIPSQGLTGAAIFHDGQTYNPARLGLAFLKSAVEAGAQAANYLEAVEFLRQGDRVVGVKAWDRLGNQEVTIRGRMVLNTAGPWAPALLRDTLDIRLDPTPTFSRDACFIVKKKLVGDHALTVLGKTKDP
ncbi:MAG TPA: FAD-dependent oxidoreductase, partial [Anaerolineales bacterium]